MAHPIRSPRNFWAGLLYAVVGAAAIALAREYGMGTGARMGPAYFPTVLGVLLILLGAVAIARALLVDGPPVDAIGWKGLILVTAGTLLFAALLRPAGLLVALVALVLVTAAASARFRPEPRALGLMAALVAFCALVFVKALGLPVPLLGAWFAR
jgi:hypothetical protein